MKRKQGKQSCSALACRCFLVLYLGLGLGLAVSALDVIPYLFYPFLLAVASLVYILLSAGKKQ